MTRRLRRAVKIKFKRHKRNILLLAGFIVLIELVLHFIFPCPEFTYFYTSEKSRWAEDPELFWLPLNRYEPQKKLMRNAPSERLLYAFGGSILTSHNANTNFPLELQKCLGTRMTVVNFGTGGYTSHQSLVLFQRMAAIKKPAVAVVCHGFNDSGTGPASDRQMAERNGRDSTAVLYYLSKSRLVSLWRRLLRRLFGYDPYMSDLRSTTVIRVPLDHFSDNLDLFALLSEKLGVSLVFVSQGSSDMAIQKRLNPYFKVMAKMSQSCPNVYYLDVRPGFLRIFEERIGGLPKSYDERSKLLFVDLCHLNDEGHTLVGEMLCNFLFENRLVK